MQQPPHLGHLRGLLAPGAQPVRDPGREHALFVADSADAEQPDRPLPQQCRVLVGKLSAIRNLLRRRTDGYTSLELEAARNFAEAAEAVGIEHIIYLGGLADPEQHIAPHMRSRIETGKILREGKVPVTEFRAGVIAGSGSISFEMICFMTELFPIMPGPLWMKNKSQPIAIQNVIDYLLPRSQTKTGKVRSSRSVVLKSQPTKT